MLLIEKCKWTYIPMSKNYSLSIRICYNYRNANQFSFLYLKYVTSLGCKVEPWKSDPFPITSLYLQLLLSILTLAQLVIYLAGVRDYLGQDSVVFNYTIFFLKGHQLITKYLMMNVLLKVSHLSKYRDEAMTSTGCNSRKTWAMVSLFSRN